MRLWLAASLLLCACSMARTQSREREQASRALPERWHYEVRANDALTQLEVTMCFAGAVAEELRPGRDEAAVHLAEARWVSPGAAQKLPVRDGRVELDASERDACVAYRVRLEETGGMDGMIRRVRDDVIASPNAWLWRPERRSADARATLRVTMPAGFSALLPWPAKDGLYTLTSQAFRFDSYAAFGKFAPVRLVHQGVPMEAALLGEQLALPPDAVARWLASAVDTVSLEGRFPAERLQVLAVVGGAGNDPVHFGMVARGGSGSVMLFVSESATEPALVSDWVLPHELSHLWFPFIDRDHAWLSEGLATYLQEVLRARGGVISGDDALTGLAQGMRSARNEGTGRDMRSESRDMHRTYAYRSVYWAGAAYFLMADVQLREKSAGKASLESVLAALRAQNSYERTWTADDVLRRMDELAGMPLFVPLSAKCLSRQFPDVEPTFEALGLRAGKDGPAMDDGAPLAHVRRALFGPARADASADSGSGGQAQR